MAVSAVCSARRSVSSAREPLSGTAVTLVSAVMSALAGRSVAVVTASLGAAGAATTLAVAGGDHLAGGHPATHGADRHPGQRGCLSYGQQFRHDRPSLQ